VVETDSALTITRIRIDSTGSERHDVILARFDFDPAYGAGDEYSITLGLDLGVARELPLGDALPLGPPGRIPATAIVTCLCRPLRPDSVRGSLTIRQRGLRQITARIDAVLHFTAWHDSSAHVAFALRQPLYGEMTAAVAGEPAAGARVAPSWCRRFAVSPRRWTVDDPVEAQHLR
jgi:hypothetical protein